MLFRTNGRYTAPKKKRKEQKAKIIYSPFIAEIKPNVDIEVGIETKGPRYIFRRFNAGLDKDLTPKNTEKIGEKTHTAFFVRYVNGSLLQNVDEPKLLKKKGSPWFNDLSAVEE